MSIRSIPVAFEYKCDQCGAIHLQENASGHYANSTPPDWMNLVISFYGKSPINILLCGNCELPIVEMLRKIPNLTL